MNKLTIGKASEVNRLRTLCCFTYACHQAGIVMNGNQMESYFGKPVIENSDLLPKSEQVLRTGKFNKLLRFSSIPSESTIRDINDKVAGIAELFNAPLWLALYCLESDSVDVQAQLECLDPDVMQHIFEPQRDVWGDLISKALLKRDIDNIFKIGSFSSLSALILLYYEYDEKRCVVTRRYLEKLIVAGFINLCVLKKIPCLHWLIFVRLADWLFKQRKPSQSFIPNSETALSKAIAHRVLFLKNFSKIKARLSEEDRILLMSLFSLGDQKLIHRETSKIFQGNNVVHAAKDEKGLYWVISKLNASNFRSDKVHLIPRNNKAQIISPRPFH